jgi:acylglycerol lipase
MSPPPFPELAHQAAAAQERVAGSGGYPLDISVWRAASPRATVVMLHGIVSHAGWLDPIASLLAREDIDVVCPDRRGSGRAILHRGDVPSGAALLEDVERVIDAYAVPGRPLHLCGFCWGAVYALRYLGSSRPAPTSLILLAPGLFPAPQLASQPLVTGNSGEATVDPVVPLDGFTRGAALEEFILPDPLRLRAVSPRFNSIVAEFGALVALRLSRVRIPTLCVLAENDRITDNAATIAAFEVVRATPRKLAFVPGEHGVQFDSPVASAALLRDWILAEHHAPEASVPAVPSTPDRSQP